jgi:ATP-dependent Clp protease ATP-binding subunit ClpA
MSKPKMSTSPVDFTDFIEKFNSKLIGQDSFKKSFEPFLKRIFLASNYFGAKEGQVLGSFILAGPSGVGKTEATKALSHALHASQKHILKIACNEFKNEHEVAKIIGAPPGYLGHRETQPLLSQARINSVSSDRSPISIILWDEIEKAHPSFQDILLGILDDGRLRTGDNNIVSFERTINIFTTNLGTSYDSQLKNYLTPQTETKEYRQARQEKAIKKYFRPEVLNRITETFFLMPFTEKEIETMFEKFLYSEMKEILDLARARGHQFNILEYSRALYKHAMKDFQTEQYGARLIKAWIQKYLYTEVGIFIANYDNPNNIDYPVLYLDYKKGKVVITVNEDCKD